MGCYRRRVPRPLRNLVIRTLLALLLAIPCANRPLFAYEHPVLAISCAKQAVFAHGPLADTLETATVVAAKVLEPIPPAESAVPLVDWSLADVLSRFTGVQVKDYGGAGGLKTVNVRSLGSEHVGIFMDGIQIENAQNMQVDLGRFSMDGLRRVSLYSGVVSKRLQTAAAYSAGAAVQLEPVHIGSGGRASFKGGTLGTVNPSFLLGTGEPGRFAVQVSGDFLYSSGRYRYPCFDTTLVRENGDIRALKLQASIYGLGFGPDDWRITLHTYGSERGFPGPVIRRAMGFPFSAERQTDQDILVQGHWTREWNSFYGTSLRAKYANNYTHYNTHPEKNPMALPYDLHYRQQSGFLSLSQSFTLGRHWSADLATDLHRNTLDGDSGGFVKPRRTTVNSALAARFISQRFRASASLSHIGAWDTFDNRTPGGWSRDNAFRGAWMHSASVYWIPSTAFEVDAFLKRSYRLPSFNDLYYTLMGNSALVPEMARQAGVDARFHRKGWELRLSPYFNRVENKIVAIPTSSQFRWTMLNIGIADITGLDARVSGFFETGRCWIWLKGRYSYQQALDHSDPGGSNYGNQIPYIPRHSGSIDASLSHELWLVSWSTVLTGGRWSRTANTPDYYIAPWSVTDLSIIRRFHPDICDVELSLNLRNIFNCRYQIVQSYPMPGFNSDLTVSVLW